MKSALVVVALAITLALVSGCGSSHRSELPAARGLASVHFPSYRLSFRYPASWTRTKCRFVTTLSSSVVYLTSVHGSPSCSGTYAGWPHALAGDDVFVWWNETSMPGQTVRDAPGADTRVGGQPARIEHLSLPARAVRLVCSRIGGQRLIVATIRQPLRTGGGQLFRVLACLRGPIFGPNETAIRRMLDSVRFTA